MVQGSDPDVRRGYALIKFKFNHVERSFLVVFRPVGASFIFIICIVGLLPTLLWAFGILLTANSSLSDTIRDSIIVLMVVFFVKNC